jgi:hypothetical protein
MEALLMQLCRDDGSVTDIAPNEPHFALRDGTPVLTRRLVAEDAPSIPIFISDVTAEDLHASWARCAR